MPNVRVKFNLALKLWLILFLSTTVLVAGLITWFQISIDRGFRQYIDRQNQAHVEALLPELLALHNSQGDWQLLIDSPSLWRQLVRDAWHRAREDNLQAEGGKPKPPPHLNHFEDYRPLPLKPPKESPSQFDRRDKTTTRIVLVDADKAFLQGASKLLKHQPNWIPVSNQEKTIAYVGYAAPKHLHSSREAKFLKNQTSNLILMGFLGLITSGVFAFILAALLVRPIRRLEASTQALTDGQYQTRIDNISQDELGCLAQHFNELAATLEANEQSRRHWVSDISHELRTPVTFIKGQIEAFIDGVRATNKENLTALEQHINQLSNLIDELYLLSQSELGAMTYKKQWLPVAELIDLSAHQASATMKDKGLKFTTDNRIPDNFLLFIDRVRFTQLLNNLLANSLRHTDTPGQVHLSAQVHEKIVTITLSDTKPGVTDQDLPKLFDRLYRADQSRNSETGGSGIGLTLCRNIVNAHGGVVQARHSELGGLTITVTLPVSPQVEPLAHD